MSKALEALMQEYLESRHDDAQSVTVDKFLESTLANTHGEDYAESVMIMLHDAHYTEIHRAFSAGVRAGIELSVKGVEV